MVSKEVMWWYSFGIWPGREDPRWICWHAQLLVGVMGRWVYMKGGWLKGRPRFSGVVVRHITWWFWASRVRLLTMGMDTKWLFFFSCSEFCHTLKWKGLGFTWLPHPDRLWSHWTPCALFLYQSAQSKPTQVWGEETDTISPRKEHLRIHSCVWKPLHLQKEARATVTSSGCVSLKKAILIKCLAYEE